MIDERRRWMKGYAVFSVNKLATFVKAVKWL